jgi:hypothetical protein
MRHYHGICHSLCTGTVNVVLAADDYYRGTSGSPIIGDVTLNDDQLVGLPEDLTVTNPGTYTITGGTLTLAANGTFSFIPSPSFDGNTSFVYHVSGAGGAEASATLYITVFSDVFADSDVNATIVNVPVTGDLSTNDEVPPGSTYTLLTADPDLVLNADGTYTFTKTTAGIYTYNIRVCPPGTSITVPPCQVTQLRITVTSPFVAGNVPIANYDIAVTYADADPAEPGQTVEIFILANDAAGNLNTELNPASVTFPTGPSKGTISYDPITGIVEYTPNAGQTGLDTFTYRVCDNASTPNCATTTVYVTIYSPTISNIVSASDDFNYIKSTEQAAGNLLTNDTQLLGNTALSVTNFGEYLLDGGILNIDSDGSYTFSPYLDFNGPISFVYEVEGTNGVTASATLYLSIVQDVVPLPDFAVGFINQSVTGNINTNDLVPVGTTYSGLTLLSSPTGSVITTASLNSSGTFQFQANLAGCVCL